MLLLLVCAATAIHAQQSHDTNNPAASAVADTTDTNLSASNTATTSDITISAEPYFSSLSNSACLTEVNRTASVDIAYADCKSNPAGTNRYQWYRYTDAYGNGKTAIAGATAETYTFTAADLNKYIRVGVTPVSSTGNFMSAGQFASTYLGPIKENSGGHTGSMTITHAAGTVAPVTKTVTYGTVSTAIGGTGTKCWITQNLGADHQPTSATDTTEAAAGWYWQWNRARGFKHDGTTRTPATGWDSSDDNTATTWQADKDPCTLLLGPGWRIPTNAEWTAADTWTSYNDTYSSVLKIHAAGYLLTDGSLIGRGNYGNVWSSTQYNATYGCYMNLNSSFAIMGISNKAYGLSVRCLRSMNYLY